LYGSLCVVKVVPPCYPAASTYDDARFAKKLMAIKGSRGKCRSPFYRTSPTPNQIKVLGFTHWSRNFRAKIASLLIVRFLFAECPRTWTEQRLGLPIACRRLWTDCDCGLFAVTANPCSRLVRGQVHVCGLPVACLRQRRIARLWRGFSMHPKS